jgi:N-acetylmuramoyl-L-alanine amidase
MSMFRTLQVARAALLGVGLVGAPSLALAKATPPLHVMVDPGHGGVDSGAVSGGVREADLVLQIAQKLEKKFNESADFKVTLTRSSDQRVALHERVRKAEMAEADIFISLHANSNSDSRVRGMEIYFQNHLPPDEETLLLAALENQKELLRETTKNRSASLSKKNDIAMIVEDLRRSSRVRSSRRLSLQLANNWESAATTEASTTRTIRQAPFHVVSRISIPSVLLELGFLTNKKDREDLKRPEVQAKIVDNLYAGLVEYKKRMDQGASP